MTDREELLEIQSRIKQAEEYMKGWHDNVKRWRMYYNMTEDDGIQRNVSDTEYKDPTFTNTVDLSVGIMLGNSLRWKAFGSKPSKREQKSTAKLEKLIDSIIFMNNIREEKDILYELFMNFNRDGGGVIYSVYDPKLDEEMRAFDISINPDSETGLEEMPILSEVPIRMQVIDPLKLIAIPGGPKRWLMVGRKETMSVFDVEITYGVELKDHKGLTDYEKSTTDGTFMDIWDYVTEAGELKIRNTILFDNEPIREPRIMEGYTDLPYTFQFFKPIGEKSEQWHNIMVPLESPLTLLEKSVNRRAHQIDMFSGMPIVTKTQPGRVVQVDPGLFNHVNISTDEDISFPQWPGNPPDVSQHQDFLRSRVQQSGFSDVMYGSGQSSIAGYALSQLGDQNRIRLEQPIRHLNLLLTVWAKKSLSLLESYAGDANICIYGFSKGKSFQDYIRVEDIEGYAVMAEIRAKFPSEETRKVAMATQAKGILSNYTILERYFDVEQPDDEENRMLIEAATSNPVTVQYAVIAELKHRADDGDEIAQMTLQAIQSGGFPGAAGRPKEGNNPEQLTGTQSPTGAPVPQAGGAPVPGQGAEAEMSRMVGASPNMSGGV